MAGFILIFGWLAMCVWATSFVMRQAPETGGQRLFYYGLIWLVPFFGAASVIILVGLGKSRQQSQSSDAMFRAIVDKHRSMNRD